MKNKEKLFYQLLAIGLIIALVVCFVKIEDLRTRINHIDNAHSNEVSSLRNQISSIYNNVDEQMKKQGSLFTNVKREFGEFNSETMKADIKISVVPKTIVDNMKVNVSLCGTSAEMTKGANGEYSTIVPIGIFEIEDYFPIVTISANGETKTEYLEEQSVHGIFSNYLPTMHGGNMKTHKASLAGGKLTVDGDFFIGYNLGDIDKKAKFEKYTLITEVAGKEIAREDITDKIKNHERVDNIENGEVDFKFNETYDLSGHDNLTIYIVAEDTYGYLHKKIAFSWHHPDTDKPVSEPAHSIEEALYVGEVILDKNGKVLFGKEI